MGRFFRSPQHVPSPQLSPFDLSCTGPDRHPSRGNEEATKDDADDTGCSFLSDAADKPAIRREPPRWYVSSTENHRYCCLRDENKLNSRRSEDCARVQSNGWPKPKDQPHRVFHKKIGSSEIERFATMWVFPPPVFTTKGGDDAPSPPAGAELDGIVFISAKKASRCMAVISASSSLEASWERRASISSVRKSLIAAASLYTFDMVSNGTSATYREITFEDHRAIN